MTQTFDNIVGSICILVATVLFETNHAITKFSQLTVTQLLFGRFLIQFIIAIMWWILNKPPHHKHWYGDIPYIKNIWMRAVLYASGLVFTWYSVKKLPLGDAETIFNGTSPIFIAIIARIYLKETLQRLFPLIVILSVIGSIFISQPSFLLNWFTNKYEYESLSFDGLLSLCMAIITYCFANILIRTAKKSHFIQLEIVNGAVMIFIGIPIIMLINEYLMKEAYIGSFNKNDWKFDSYSILIMLIQGIIGFVSICFLVIGYQKGEATKVSMFEYFSIVFACFYQTFLFHDILNIFEIIGIVTVSISSMLIVIEQYYDYYKSTTIQYDPVSVY